MTNWAEELEQKYIEFFETFEGEETERGWYKKGHPLRGIECGEGWRKPIEKFLASLVWIKDKYDYVDNPNFDSTKPLTHENPIKIKGDKPEIKIFQIKEKFGEVRCYVTAPEQARDIVGKSVAKLEAMCSVTCEVCGKLEYGCIKSTQRGWVYCLCNDCYDTRVKKISYT